MIDAHTATWHLPTSDFHIQNYIFHCPLQLMSIFDQTNKGAFQFPTPGFSFALSTISLFIPSAIETLISSAEVYVRFRLKYDEGKNEWILVWVCCKAHSDILAPKIISKSQCEETLKSYIFSYRRLHNTDERLLLNWNLHSAITPPRGGSRQGVSSSSLVISYFEVPVICINWKHTYQQNLTNLITDFKYRHYKHKPKIGFTWCQPSLLFKKKSARLTFEIIPQFCYAIKDGTEIKWGVMQKLINHEWLSVTVLRAILISHPSLVKAI